MAKKNKKSNNKSAGTKAKSPKPTITIVNETKVKEKPKKSGAAAFSEFMNDVDMSKPMESTGELLGRRLGAFAGRLLGKISGVGDYETDLPPGGLPISDTVVPQFIKTENARETRIRHREFIGNVYADGVAGRFKNTVYSLNPGNEVLFPWLAGIAQHYDQWEPHGVVVIFKTLTSTYAASQSLGTVVIASDYDVYDPSYTTKVEMANSEFAVSGNAAQNLMHPIECNSQERMTKTFTVLSGPLSTVDNKRFFDLCNIQVASEGCLANQLLGELWITYDLSFYKPQLPLNPTGLGLVHYAFTAETATSGNPFGGIVAISPYSTADLVRGLTSNSFRFNPRYLGYHFLVQVRIYDIVGTGGGWGVTFNGCQLVGNMWTLNANTTGSVGIENQSNIYQFHLEITPDAYSIHTFTFSASPTGEKGPNNRWSTFTSIDQCHPQAFNYAGWSPLP